jgi:pyridine nucleotide-disulfide oxidoreductase family protein
VKRLVLLGGGHAHLEVLRDLAVKPAEGFTCTLVTPYPRFIYSGMVPGVVAGHYKLEECAVGLEALAQRARVEFVQLAAIRIDPIAREVICDDVGVIPYDVLSLDVGARPLLGAAVGAREHAVMVRPLEVLLKGWGSVLARARAGAVRSITVVGGGAAGVELALAMDHRLRTELATPAPHVRVITNTPVLLPEFGDGARRRIKRRLARRNIGSHVSSTVAEVGLDHVRLEGGLDFASDATFWAGGAGAHDWIKASGLAVDERGFLLTNDFLQSVTFADVFGAGDCATQEGRRYAKAGVFAVRAAPVLAANLRAAIAGTPLVPFRTDPRYMALISTGSKHAVGVWNGLSWQGRLAWHWKDRIDRGFVAKYSAQAK